MFKKYPRKNGIIEADPDVLKKLLKKFKNVVVYFYSKGCHKCKKLNKQFPKIVKEHLSFMEPNLIPIVRFPCSKFPEHCSLNRKITHYPTIRVYYKQKHYTNYLGKFDPFKLSKFLTQRVFYSSFEIGQSNYSIEHILDNKQLVVMKLHPDIFQKENRYSNKVVDDGKDSDREEQELEAFKLLGFRTHHAHFYYSKDYETANEYYQRICKSIEPQEDVKSASFVIMNPDDNVCYLFLESLVHARYDGKLVPNKKTINNGLNFVKKHQHPLIMEFTEKMALRYQKKSLPYVTYFTSEGILNNLINFQKKSAMIPTGNL